MKKINKDIDPEKTKNKLEIQTQQTKNKQKE